MGFESLTFCAESDANEVLGSNEIQIRTQFDTYNNLDLQEI